MRSQDPGELLVAGLQALGIPNVHSLSSRLLAFGRFVLEEGRRTNLTGARDLTGIVRDHVLDSLAPLMVLELSSPVVDVGSGAGFPGIPAAIVYPEKDFVLLEPRAKRAAFLETAVRRLGLKNVVVLKTSAGGPGAGAIAGKAASVLMRAVAEPGKALPLGLRLLRRGGKLLLYEGRRSRSTAAERRAAASAGGGKIEIKRVDVPGLAAVRHAWIVEKRAGAKPLDWANRTSVRR